MKLKAIEATRYGAFEGECLAGLGDGLTVVLGPNEAGKSTMTALTRHVLYGYPDARTKEYGYLSSAGPRVARLVFAENDRTDFVEVALGALQVLGEASAPGDLLLAFDQRIAHVLVDEFQDTSLAQFGLIARLTAGWSQGDGRTLFAVGDPMQSVYRFRGAEVGLFLDAQHDGLNEIPLQPLRLRVNFRSRAPLVAQASASLFVEPMVSK